MPMSYCVRNVDKCSLRDRKLIAQEYRAFGRNQLAGFVAVEYLAVAVVLFADPDRSLREAAAIGGDP